MASRMVPWFLYVGLEISSSSTLRTYRWYLSFSTQFACRKKVEVARELETDIAK